jgi:hypothetical protein
MRILILLFAHPCLIQRVRLRSFGAYYPVFMIKILKFALYENYCMFLTNVRTCRICFSFFISSFRPEKNIEKTTQSFPTLIYV